MLIFDKILTMLHPLRRHCDVLTLLRARPTETYERRSVRRSICLIPVILMVLLMAARPEAQTVIWEETFISPLGNGMWTEASTDCDGNPASFWGVRGGQFEAQDMEGAPCCNVAGGRGGGNGNQWITNQIDIAGRCNVSISVNYGGSVGGGPNDDFECVSSGSAIYLCDNAQDQIHLEYRLNSGAWTTFGYGCTEDKSFSGTATRNNLRGNTLQIRVRMATKGTDEVIWFDDVVVRDEGGGAAAVNAIAPQNVCSGGRITIPVSGTPGTTFRLESSDPSVGPLPPTTNGAVNFTAAVVTSQQQSTITVTPVQGGCPGTPRDFIITVNPVPEIEPQGAPFANVCPANNVRLRDLPVFDRNSVSGNISYHNSQADARNNAAALNPNLVVTANRAIWVRMAAGTCFDVEQFQVEVNPCAVCPDFSSGSVNITPASVPCGSKFQSFELTGLQGITFPNALGYTGVQFVAFTNTNLTNPYTETGNQFPIGTVPGGRFSNAGQTALLNNPAQINLLAPGTYRVCALLNPLPSDPNCLPYSCANSTIQVVNFPIDTNPSFACNGVLKEPLRIYPGERFTWINNNTSVGLPPSGTDSIPRFIAVNNGTTPIRTRITITPGSGSCMRPHAFTLQVDPVPSLTLNTPTCSADRQTYTVTGSATSSARITVRRPVGAGTFTGTADNFTVSNIPKDSILVVAADGGIGCDRVLTIAPPNCNCITTPNPPTGPAPRPICEGDPNPALTVTVGVGETVNWYNAATGGLPILSGNATFTPPAGTLLAGQTYTFYAETRRTVDGCNSATRTPVQVTVTGRPTLGLISNVDPVCGGANVATIPLSGSAGATFAWTNDNPRIGLAASGTIPGTAFPSFTTLNPAVQEVANIRIVARAGTCESAPRTFTITVNPAPTLALDQIQCTAQPAPNWTVRATTNGTGVTATPTGTATGSGGVFTVAVPTATNITVVATGVGGCTTSRSATAPNCTCPPNIAAPINPGNPAPICFGAAMPTLRATVGAGLRVDWYTDATAGVDIQLDNANFTPPSVGGPGTYRYYAGSRDANNCRSLTRTEFVVVVNPAPTMTKPNDVAVCANAPIPAINFAGTPAAGTTFAWRNDNPAVGLAASGTGNIAAFTAGNVTALTTANVTVTPSLGGCAGPPQNFTITLSPAPTLTTAPPVCNGRPATTYSVTGTTTGTIVRSTLGVVSLNGNNFTVTGININQNVVITAVDANNCQSAPLNVTRPNCDCPAINPPVSAGDQAVCVGPPAPVIPALRVTLPTGNPALIAEWFMDATGGLPILRGNNAYTPAMLSAPGVYTFYVQSRDTVTTCVSATRTPVRLTINPRPTLLPLTARQLCAGDTLQVNFSGTAGATFNWSNDNTAIGLPSAGTSSSIGTIIPVNLSGQQVAQITVTPALSTCTGASQTFSLTANPLPAMLADSVACPTTPSTTFNLRVRTSGTTDLTASAGTVSGRPPLFRVTGIPTAAGTVVIRASNSATGCRSVPQTVTAPDCSCPAVPAPTAGRPDTICLGAPTPTLSVTPGAGLSVTWFDAPTAGAALRVDSARYTPPAATVAGTRTFYVESRDAGGCRSSLRTPVTLTVRPVPLMNFVRDTNVCGGAAVPSIVFSSSTPGATFAWTNGNTTVGIARDGVGNIPAFTAPRLGAPQMAILGVRATVGGCVGPLQNFSIQIFPSPVLTRPTARTFCAGDTVSVNFSGTTGATYAWTNSNTNIGLGTSGTGNIAFTAANVVAAADSSALRALITVTPTLNIGLECRGVAETVLLTLNPKPQVDTLGDLRLCAGQSVPEITVRGTTGAAFNWIGGNPTLGMTGADGIGNIPGFRAVNATGGALTTDIRVTPTLRGCTGAPEPFRITVNPIPSLTLGAIACNAARTGYSVQLTTAGANTVSAPAPATVTGNAGAFTVDNIPSGTNTTITVTNSFGCSIDQPVNGRDCNCPAVAAPTGGRDTSICVGGAAPALRVNVSTGLVVDWFDAATAGTSLATNSATFTPNVANPGVYTFYAEARNSADGCRSATRTPVRLTVTATPMLSAALPDLGPFCPGDTLPGVVFTSVPAGATFTWTNDNTQFGLPASGTGNIPRTRIGAVTGGQTARLTVRFAQNGCPGTESSFNIRASAAPTLAVQTTCAPNLRTYRLNVTTNNGNTVSLTPAVGVQSGANGAFVFDSIPVGTSVTVRTSNGGGCSLSESVTSPLCPCPTVAPPTSRGDRGICAGEPIPALVMQVAAANETVNWYRTANGGTPEASNTLTFTPTGASTPRTDTFYTETVNTVTNCRSVSRTRIILSINAVPDLLPISDQTACAGDTLQRIIFSGFTGATFEWMNSNTAVGLVASGTGNIAPFVSPRVTAVQSATIVVTPRANGCPGTPQTFRLRVNPLPTLNPLRPVAVCAGSPVRVTFQGSPGSSFNWTNSNPAIGLSPFGSGNLDFSTPGLVDTESGNIEVTATADGCSSLPQTFRLTVGAISGRIVAARTCNRDSTGSFTRIFRSTFGCDSTVNFIRTYDSTLVDTTILRLNTCDRNQPLIDSLRFTTRQGCDSIVLKFYTLREAVRMDNNVNTCDAALAGQILRRDTLKTAFGCDSIITRQYVLNTGPKDTTRLDATTCDRSLAGIERVTLRGSDGCDSIILINRMLLRSDTILLNETTCVPGNAGTFLVARLRNTLGCDSLLLRRVTFDPNQRDTVRLAANTCDPAQPRETVQRLRKTNGCDSIVITAFTLLQRDSTILNESTCNRQRVGVFPRRLTNRLGCDSIVIRSVTYDSTLIPVTFLNALTCRTDSAGIDTLNLRSFEGCDSIVIVNTLYNAFGCPPDLSARGDTLSCSPDRNGAVSINIRNGQAPYRYSWEGGGRTGVNLPGPTTNVPFTIDSLGTGRYTVTVTSANGFTAVVTAVVTSPPLLIVRLTAPPRTGAFDFACAADSTGALTAAPTGGTPGYTYRWSDRPAIDSALTRLTPGSYTVTVTDRNGCTATDNRPLTAPPTLGVATAIPKALCGQETITASLSATGGTRPYVFSLDGNPVPDPSKVVVGAGEYMLQITDANRCTLDSVLRFDVPPVPIIALPRDTTIRQGTRLTLEAETNLLRWRNIRWEPLEDSTGRNSLRQTWLPRETQIIRVQIVDSLGCVGKAEMTIVVEDKIDLYIPNIFTPNGDGIEDLFVLNAGKSVETLKELYIFDRWGNQVYGWNAPVRVDEWTGWDGFFRNQRVLPGVYVYYLTVVLANGESVLLKGDVTVLR